MKNKQFDTGIGTFSEIQEAKATFAGYDGSVCKGCGREIDGKYDQCYACNRYGVNSYAQVRQRSQQTSELLYSVAHNCTGCGNVLPEDSTELHICPQKSADMPTFKQQRATQRKTRKASKVRTLTPMEKGIDAFDSRPRVFAGF